ncbi:MAG: hypothetical protein V4858_00250 [Pseudomonadota bacterium]
MPAHPYSPTCGCPACLRTLDTAFQELRESLSLLMVALKELQSICEQERQASCERAVKNLLHELSKGHLSGTSGNPSQ